MDKKTLYRLFNGEASEEDKEQINSWLNEETENLTVFIQERKMFDILLFSKVKPAKRMSNRFPLWKKHGFREAVRIAAVVLLTCGISVFFTIRQQEQWKEQTNRVSVPPGQRTDIVLGDGTRICLNSGSEIQYPAFFSGNERRVKLKGEAYFEVKHSDSKPFVVETSDYSVKVLGTRFYVDAYADHQFVTSLQEGLVCIYKNTNPSAYTLLQPGQQAIGDKKKKMLVTPIKNTDTFRWTEGLICFEDKTFEELMEDFRKNFGVEIVIQKTPGHNRFSGKFLISDGIEQALRILQRNSDFDFRRNSEKNIVYIQ